MGLTKKIIFFHLLNDFSGSPKVLREVIKVAHDSGIDVDLYTSNSVGFLSEIERVNRHDIKYKLVKSKWITLFRLLISQLRLIFILRKYRKKEVLFYVNTLLPFGAALAGKLYGIKVIYHLHETSISPQLWKRFLLLIVKTTAHEVIYVSKYLKEKEPIRGVKSQVVYNAISKDFLTVKREFRLSNIVLMACSLKEYKGVDEFVKLSVSLPSYTFKLVLNATQKEINNYFKGRHLPENIKLYPKQKQLHSFYKEAAIVLNLSIPSQWIETFGLTIIEAMAYGIPTIVPTVGGPAEIVNNSVNGYNIDSHKTDKLVKTIDELFKNKKLYERISKQALESISKFSLPSFQYDIKAIIINS